MLIFSWNVAGLSTTLKRIESDYAVTADHDDVTLASSSSTALARWLRRHHDPDVVCLQEHKIPLAVVSSSSSGGGLDLPDREAFWSCTVDPRRRGLDGVCTSCRRGRVVRADPRPLTDLPCGGAGRCLLTDHGAFVLFNVYAPAGSNPWGERRKFYEALRSAMRRKREEEGRRVVLVGDLNVAHGKRDVPWRSLLVDTDAVRNEVEEHRRRRGGGTKDGNGTEASASSDTKLPAWTSDLERCWTEITDALKTLETVPVTTTNPATGATFQRRRATVSFIRPDGVVRKIVLGKPEETTEDAVWPYTFEHDEFWCDDDDDNKEKKDNKKKTLIRKRNLVRIDVLSELVHKVGGTVWTIAQQREIARTHGDVNRDSPSRRWFENLIEDDGMVDVFRTLHPGVEDSPAGASSITNASPTRECASTTPSWTLRCSHEHPPPPLRNSIPPKRPPLPRRPPTVASSEPRTPGEASLRPRRGQRCTRSSQTRRARASPTRRQPTRTTWR